jgi:hypothetical protein
MYKSAMPGYMAAEKNLSYISKFKILLTFSSQANNFDIFNEWVYKFVHNMYTHFRLPTTYEHKHHEKYI